MMGRARSEWLDLYAQRYSEVWAPPPRSTTTGHRIPVDGRPPIPSRRLPWWSWLFEPVDRLHARLMAGQPGHVRDGLEPAGNERTT
jgi:hypothetical protein